MLFWDSKRRESLRFGLTIPFPSGNFSYLKRLHAAHASFQTSADGGGAVAGACCAPPCVCVCARGDDADDEHCMDGHDAYAARMAKLKDEVSQAAATGQSLSWPQAARDTEGKPSSAARAEIKLEPEGTQRPPAALQSSYRTPPTVDPSESAKHDAGTSSRWWTGRLVDPEPPGWAELDRQALDRTARTAYAVLHTRTHRLSLRCAAPHTRAAGSKGGGGSTTVRTVWPQCETSAIGEQWPPLRVIVP